MPYAAKGDPVSTFNLLCIPLLSKEVHSVPSIYSKQRIPFNFFNFWQYFTALQIRILQIAKSVEFTWNIEIFFNFLQNIFAALPIATQQIAEFLESNFDTTPSSSLLSLTWQRDLSRVEKIGWQIQQTALHMK